MSAAPKIPRHHVTTQTLACLPSGAAIAARNHSIFIPSSIPVSTTGKIVIHEPNSFTLAMGTFSSAASSLSLPQLVFPLFHPCLDGLDRWRLPCGVAREHAVHVPAVHSVIDHDWRCCQRSFILAFPALLRVHLHLES